MVCHYLEAWGCPPGLVADLASTLEGDGNDHGESQGLHMSSPVALPSRTMLLALAWLTGKCELFERELKRLQPKAEHLFLLPPLPEVSRAHIYSPEGGGTNFT